LIDEKKRESKKERETVGSCFDDEFHADADAVDVNAKAGAYANAKAKSNASADDIVAFVALQLSISIAKCSRIGIGTNTHIHAHTHTHYARARNKRFLPTQKSHPPRTRDKALTHGAALMPRSLSVTLCVSVNRTSCVSFVCSIVSYTGIRFVTLLLLQLLLFVAAASAAAALLVSV